MIRRKVGLLTIAGLVCSIILTTGMYAVSKIPTDAENNGLQGPVKMITEDTYKLIYKFGTLTQEFVERSISRYTREGACTETTHYSSNGAMSSHIVYILDTNGKTVKMTTYNELGALESRSTFTYESSGTVERMIQKLYTANGSLDYVYVYNYNVDGRMLEANTYKANGSLSMHVTNSYDTQNKLVEADIYDAQGKLSAKMTWTYSKQGIMIESASVMSLNGVDWLSDRSRYSEYKFDIYGNWIKRLESEWVKKFGKEYWEPRKVEYRTIIYYRD